jgi:hypothetical protein
MTANPILRLGDRKPEVTRLQQLLNAKLRPSPNLKADGTFGQTTKAAVERFQNLNWLSKDGIVGQCVWSALEGRDKYVILHTITLVPQWTPATCWSAALSMLLGGGPACMSPGKANASPTGGLFNDSELSRPENTQKFADSYRLTLLLGASWTADGLAGLLRAHGPLMMNLLWNAPSYAAGQGSSGHMLIIAGIRGDGSDDGTTLRIYDPWPIGKGSIYSLSYGPFMRKLPASTYQLYHK